MTVEKTRPPGIIRWEVGLLLLLAFVALTLFVVGRLGSEVIEGEALAFDRWLLTILREPANPAMPIGPPWLRRAMFDVTTLGGGTFLTVLTLLAVGYLLAAKKAHNALLLAVAIAGGALISSLLKIEFARPRPDLVAHLVDVRTASFPSGHAMNSAVTYLTIGALLARAEAKRRIKAYLIGVALLLTLTIGFSRIYLGVHWPSDVLAGWAVGGLWASLCWLVAIRLQRHHQIEPPSS